MYFASVPGRDEIARLHPFASLTLECMHPLGNEFSGYKVGFEGRPNPREWSGLVVWRASRFQVSVCSMSKLLRKCKGTRHVSWPADLSTLDTIHDQSTILPQCPHSALSRHWSTERRLNCSFCTWKHSVPKPLSFSNHVSLLPSVEGHPGDPGMVGFAKNDNVLVWRLLMWV